jgi:predicted aminopeptidase
VTRDLGRHVRSSGRLEMIFRRGFRGALLAGLMTTLLSGCSPIYVMRAAFEESKILWRREPIAEVLATANLAKDTRQKLELVLAVRAYAQNRLKLNVGGSYASLSHVDRRNLSFILTAAPQTELKAYTWWFLFIGSVPYKGYFSREDADAAAAELQAEGYDTSIRSTAAFSTLGWFDDPLLSRLLKYDEVTLADIIFHELFHNTLYVKGAGNFNESVANFVGGRGAIDFFRERDGDGSPQHQRAVERWRQELEFSAFIEQLAQSLTELYARDIPAEEKLRLRQGIFSSGQEAWKKRIASRPWAPFYKFYQQPLNNAVMIQYLLYLKNLRLFEALYKRQGCDLVRTIDAIRKAMPEGNEPFETVQSLLADQPHSTGCRPRTVAPSAQS